MIANYVSQTARKIFTYIKQIEEESWHGICQFSVANNLELISEWIEKLTATFHFDFSETNLYKFPT